MARPLTGRKTLAILLASFGVVFAVNGYMIARAVGTYSGEDADNAYLQGANFNETLARRAQQARLGWHATIAAGAETNGALRIVVEVADRRDRPVGQLTMAGELRHPSDANRDKRFAITEERPGVYAATLAHVARGAWDVVVNTTGHHPPFEASGRIWLR